MPLSLYEVSIPALVHGLGQLSHLLRKAQAHVEASGGDAAALLNARLFDDMLPLTAQVQRASDTSKGTGERLSGVPSPKLPDTEQSFDELQARIAATVGYLQSLTPAQIDGNEDKEITLSFGPLQSRFSGSQYLTQFGLPNFYFHLGIAHGILRQQGVAVGKLDFIGRIGNAGTT